MIRTQISRSEWVAEGLTLVFLGVLIVVVTASGSPSAAVRTALTGLTAGMLLVMAGLTAATGANPRRLLQDLPGREDRCRRASRLVRRAGMSVR